MTELEIEFEESLTFVEDKESQNKTIRKHLESGQLITPRYADRKYGIMRLAARIKDLRDLGLNITTTMVSRNGKRFAEYKLEK
jgi:hypothetical protein